MHIPHRRQTILPAVPAKQQSLRDLNKRRIEDPIQLLPLIHPKLMPEKQQSLKQIANLLNLKQRVTSGCLCILYKEISLEISGLNNTVITDEDNL